MKKIIAICGITFLFVLFIQAGLDAQCPMCRMSAETNLQNGGSEGRGLNRGILYMLSLPYLLVFSLGYLWWRNKKKYTDEIFEEPFSDN